MAKHLTSLTFAALLGLSSALGAQEVDDAAPDAENEVPETQAQPSDLGLDTGREVAVEDPSYIKASFDDWQLKCFRSEVEGQEDLCQMYQLLTESAGNPVAEFSIYRLPESSGVAAGATIAAPLGTLLTEEIKLSVDGGNAKSYAYSFCTMAGCFARIGLTDTDIDAMKRGITATLEIVPAQAPDQKVRIEASLKGFSAAYEEVSILNN